MRMVRMGVIEEKFANIVWEHGPLSTRELIDICARELNWARTTTYTILKKCCERGVFHLEKKQVTILMTKEEFHALQSEQFVDSAFEGSLPAFVAAFATRKPIPKEQIAELRQLLDNFQG